MRELITNFEIFIIKWGLFKLKSAAFLCKEIVNSLQKNENYPQGSKINYKFAMCEGAKAKASAFEMKMNETLQIEKRSILSCFNNRKYSSSPFTFIKTKVLNAKTIA